MMLSIRPKVSLSKIIFLIQQSQFSVSSFGQPCSLFVKIPRPMDGRPKRQIAFCKFEAAP
jgi:hypothetical protein